MPHLSSGQQANIAFGTLTRLVSFAVHANRRSFAVGNTAGIENIKDKLAKAKQLRGQRRSELKSEYSMVFDVVAHHINATVSDVEEFVVDGAQQLSLISSFFAKNGRKTLMFFHQMGDAPVIEEQGRSIPGHARGDQMMKVFITDGRTQKLNGSCLYFIRLNCNVALTNPSEITFGIFDASAPVGGAVTGLEMVLEKVFFTSFKKYKDWGELSDQAGQMTVRNFIDNCRAFVDCLRSAVTSTFYLLRLAKCESVNLDEIYTVHECRIIASDSKALESVESIVWAWCGQIEQVIVQSEQMRKEADDTGPLAELEHWRQRTARFSGIQEQIKSHRCRMALNILNTVKSKVLLRWKILDSKITERTNEAKDNRKFLYSLEKCCEPLYLYEPPEIAAHLPSLINAVRMINSISMYYNTSEHMTSLFIKITNQMVKSCKSYLSNNGTAKIWDLPLQEILAKINVCTNLYGHYKDAFYEVKRNIESTPGERRFNFSEMYIFGKFEAFCKRLVKIQQLILMIVEFSTFETLSIEGTEQIVTKFQGIYSKIKKKPHDILDHRKPDFDITFLDFKRQMADLEVYIRDFVDDAFAKTSTVMQALKLLEVFERCYLKNIGLDEKYRRLFIRFDEIIERITKEYETDKDDPPVPRGMPPVSGKIAWSRQLYRTISEPMQLFARRPDVFRNGQAKKVIRNYNRIAATLIEFEMLHYNSWKQSLTIAEEAVQVPVLVKHKETKELYMNFDSLIFEMIMETRYMKKLNLDIPEIARSLCMAESRLKSHYASLKSLLEDNARLRASIPDMFITIMSPLVQKVDIVIRPGLLTLSWFSLNLTNFFCEFRQALTRLTRLVTRLNSMIEQQIHRHLDEIATTQLCDVPEGEAWDVEVFLENTNEQCDRCSIRLQLLNHKVEDAVKEILWMISGQISAVGTGLDESFWERLGSCSSINVLHEMTHETGGISQLGVEAWLKMQCGELFKYYSQKCFEALLKATKSSLEILRKRCLLNRRASIGYPGNVVEEDAKDKGMKHGFFRAYIVLAIPNIGMQPTLDEIQSALNKAVQKILTVSKSVTHWGHSTPEPHLSRPKSIAISVYGPDTSSKNHYKAIHDHKDVTKTVMMLTSSIKFYRSAIQIHLVQQRIYKFLWEDDRDAIIKEFLDQEPTLSDFRDVLANFDKLIVEIQHLSESVKVGAIVLFTGK